MKARICLHCTQPLDYPSDANLAINHVFFLFWLIGMDVFSPCISCLFFEMCCRLQDSETLLSLSRSEGGAISLSLGLKAKRLPSSPFLVIHFHGGGFVAQTSKSHEVRRLPLNTFTLHALNSENQAHGYISVRYDCMWSNFFFFKLKYGLKCTALS